MAAFILPLPCGLPASAAGGTGGMSDESTGTAADTLNAGENENSTVYDWEDYLADSPGYDENGSGAYYTGLSEGTYVFGETWTIKSGHHIYMRAFGDVDFKRADGFNGTMIEIEQGASLSLALDEDDSEASFTFDGEGKSVRSGVERFHGTFIHTEGELTLNGAEFVNEYIDPDRPSMGNAPICGMGSDAEIYFNSGKVANTDFEARSGSGSFYSAGGFYLAEGAYMEMNGGSIENCDVSLYDYNAGSWMDNKNANGFSAGAVLAEDGSEFIMNGGTITGNRSSVGAVLAGTASDFGDISADRAADSLTDIDIPKTKLTITEGTISNNSGIHYSGGVMVSGSANAEMSGGVITGNRGSSAGGVCVADFYVEGSQGIDQTRAKVSIEEWAQKYPAGFVMTGGTVSDNTGYSAGGGIYVASDSVFLSGGNITDNQAPQGGGVYVAAQPYVLCMENGVIAENKATTDVYDPSGSVMEDDGQGGKAEYELKKGAGGGAWFCPTGNAKFFVENGAVFRNNTADVAGDDFHSEVLVPYADLYNITLPSRLSNGSIVRWYEDAEGARYSPENAVERTELTDFTVSASLKAVSGEKETMLAEQKTTLNISGNTASKGGGIGSNGTVIFGTPPTDTVDLKIQKIWGEGTEPEEVEAEVRARLADGTDYWIETAVLNEENDYTYTLRELPAMIEGEQTEDILYVTELNADDYNTVISDMAEIETDGEGKTVYQINIVNTKKETPEEPDVPEEPDAPDEPETPDKTEARELPAAPQTGDKTDLTPWIVTGIVCLLLITGAIVYKIKKK